MHDEGTLHGQAGESVGHQLGGGSRRERDRIDVGGDLLGVQRAEPGLVRGERLARHAGLGGGAGDRDGGALEQEGVVVGKEGGVRRFERPPCDLIEGRSARARDTRGRFQLARQLGRVLADRRGGSENQGQPRRRSRGSHRGRPATSLRQLGIDSLTPTTARHLINMNREPVVTVTFRKTADRQITSCRGDSHILEESSINAGRFTLMCTSRSGAQRPIQVGGFGP